MGRVEGKVAFITGAARGQGRSHAVRLAEEGADIIAVDICADFDSITYPMATPEDLEETARLVEKHGRRIVTAKADVRKVDELRAVLERGVAELGQLDIVVAQAGVAGMRGEPDIAAWSDTVDTNLVGTINAIQAALPYLGKGASIIATGSTASMIDTSKGAENSVKMPTPTAAPTTAPIVTPLPAPLGAWAAPASVPVSPPIG